MADVTATPVLIDTGLEQSAQFTFRDAYYQGPFKIGSNLYVVLRTTLGTPKHINVFKSTDAGLTWTQQDTANSPVIVDTNGFCRYQVYLNPDGITLTIGYNAIVTNAANTVTWATFSTATDTFTSGVIPALTDGGAGNVTGLRGNFDFVVRANGDILICYGKIIAPDVTQTSLGFRVLSSGVWGTYTVIAPGDDGTLDQYSVPAIVLDSGGVTHVFSLKSYVILAQAYLGVAYQQIDALDAFTAVVLLTPDIANYNPAFGRPIEFGDSVCLPVYSTVSSTGGTISFIAQSIIGTPLSTPTFTITQLDSGESQVFDSECCQFTIDGGNLWALWLYWPDETAIEIRRSINTGSGWGTNEVYYDLLTNPPNALPAANQAIFGFTCASVASVGVVFTDNDPSNISFEAYYITGSATPPVPAGVAASQLVFYGVRRVKDARFGSDPARSRYRYYEKVYQIPLVCTLTEAFDPALFLLNQCTRFQVTVVDHDFELRQIKKQVLDAHGVPVAVSSPFAMVLYDGDKVARSNAPVIAEFICDDVNVDGNGRNFWPAPGILYRVNQVISVDLFSMLSTSVALPVTVHFMFNGVRRIACG